MWAVDKVSYFVIGSPSLLIKSNISFILLNPWFLEGRLCLWFLKCESANQHIARKRHFYSWILWIHKMYWRRLPCHFFWIYFSTSFCSCSVSWFLIGWQCWNIKCWVKFSLIGLVNVVQLWPHGHCSPLLQCLYSIEI